MIHKIEAACYCSAGEIRKNNEDNFYFGGSILEEENKGLSQPLYLQRPMNQANFMAIFDGMGGENYGEKAAYAAANSVHLLLAAQKTFPSNEYETLNKMCVKLNEAVVEKKQELCTEHMGATMVALCFAHKYINICNLGDSRAYRLRKKELVQLSVDHVGMSAGETKRKAPLTQYLGIDPEEVSIEPYIVREKWKSGDQYLLCSDGLTDMLTDSDISELMKSSLSVKECARKLIDSANEKGGRDNVTAIVCKIF